jgi:type III secretion protein V
MSMDVYFSRMSSGARREGLLSRSTDLALVLGVAAIIALMILPLPAMAIDGLIALNITFGIIMLMVSIYIGSALEFSVFPSVLLITTLYRLSLSIATTRMILIQGHAGHIIDAFGNMVAGGNLVVGLVVFLIITVVQFIVIAKGAERVAEVAARFSLDAMPGKQLSIDSDLRSGLVDKDEARRRRKVLELESKLHGSLDGAMKFVKGDAMASIIIVAVNILGGLAVGVLQKGMDFGSAIQTYSILTIGDGLVTQIPALLAAMSAGLIVTRTSDEDVEKHLGDALRRQLGTKPRVFQMASLLLFAMAFVPGFPWPVFAVMGLCSLATGVFLDAEMRDQVLVRLKPVSRALGREKPVRLEVAATRQIAVRPMAPLLLELTGERVQTLDGLRLTTALERELDRFEIELGLALPPMAVHALEKDAPATWRLLAFEAPIGAGFVSADEAVADLAAAVREAIRRHIGVFVGIQETANLLNRASLDYPEVVKEAARALPTARIAEVLRRLAEEEVSLRNLRDILEGVADAGQREKDPFALTEFARVALRRQISHRHAEDGVLRALVLAPELEARLREAVRTQGGAQSLALEPELAARLLTDVCAQVAETGAGVIVTAIDLRRHLRKLIEPDLFNVAVLSFHELHPSLKLDVLGTVRVSLASGLLQAAE